MDAAEQGSGAHIDRSGRIPIHLLLTTPEAAAQQQQEQEQQRQHQHPPQPQPQLQPQQQQQYQRPPEALQTAGSSSSGGAAGGRKESTAGSGQASLPSAFEDPLATSPASLPSPVGAPAASYNQIFGSASARPEYTPLQPQQPALYSIPHVEASSSTSPPWSPVDSITRKPRAPRPSYSEEQKFFIMYARIMRDLSWPEIEDRFADTFGQRSKGGLTSVYYRVRRDWGLAEVLKSGPGTFAADCREVELRARNFSKEFLVQIGYIPPS